MFHVKPRPALRLRFAVSGHGLRSRPARRVSCLECGMPHRGRPAGSASASPTSSAESPPTSVKVSPSSRRVSSRRNVRMSACWRGRYPAYRASVCNWLSARGGISRSQENARVRSAKAISGSPASSNTERQRPSARTAMPSSANVGGHAPSALARRIAAATDASCASNAAARSCPMQPHTIPFLLNRRSALSARSVRRYSAREVNIRYGSLTPCVVRSSISTPI